MCPMHYNLYNFIHDTHAMPLTNWSSWSRKYCTATTPRKTSMCPPHSLDLIALVKGRPKTLGLDSKELLRCIKKTIFKDPRGSTGKHKIKFLQLSPEVLQFWQLLPELTPVPQNRKKAEKSRHLLSYQAGRQMA